jgi:hypothetical protein
MGGESFQVDRHDAGKSGIPHFINALNYQIISMKPANDLLCRHLPLSSPAKTHFGN